MQDKFKIKQKTDSEKNQVQWKNVQNLKNYVEGILWFWDNMPDKNREDPTEIVSGKVSLPLMANKSIDQLLTI